MEFTTKKQLVDYCSHKNLFSLVSYRIGNEQIVLKAVCFVIPTLKGNQSLLRKGDYIGFSCSGRAKDEIYKILKLHQDYEGVVEYLEVRNAQGSELTIDLSSVCYLYLDTATIEGYLTFPTQQMLSLRCTRCGEIFSLTRAEYDHLSQEDNCLCHECRRRHYILPYHRYYPHLNFFGQVRNNASPYLGVEIEVAMGGESNTTASKCMDIINQDDTKPFIYCSHDGSLDEGFEIITQPATLKHHLSLYDNFSQMFKFLVSRGYQAHNTTCCGIHIHFNRNYFADNESLYISRLLFLVEHFWEEIVIFSRRNQRSFDRYAKKVDMPIEDFIYAFDKKRNHEGHYYAINLSNLNTIEFRMFRGTLNPKSYRAILEFVDSVVRICRTCSTEEIRTMKFMDILPPHAKAYYKSRIQTKEFEE